MNGDVILRGTRWRVGEASFTSPREILIADRPDQVVGVIRSAEAAARSGNWVVGYLSYDAAPGLDHHLATPGRSDEPLAWFATYPDSGPVGRVEGPPAVIGTWEPSMSRSEHSRNVEAIKEHIRNGDTYQVNLTMAMSAPVQGDVGALFEAMVASQPKSYGALIDLGDREIVSISPELFLKGNGSNVMMRPMKGTAPRGRSASEDHRNRRGLEISEKERSGNVMIVDMLRNDLGRVAVTGSVRTPELFVAERHPTVWQLTSTVEAELSTEVDLAGLLAATFPSGSVTGAPKVSTMRIISALESVPRGVYCGAIGYIEPGGDRLEFSVAIRTGVIRDGMLNYHVGGGITVDSDPEVEYEECLWKALVVTASDERPDLMETMRYEPGEGIPLLQRHLERLSSSARYWEIPLEPAAVGEALSAVESSKPIKVRLILFRDGEVEVETEELGESDEPVSLDLARERVDPSEPHWFHKTLERSRYPETEEGEVLLVNLNGEVTETNISNVMARFGGTWVTPPVEAGCLPGVYRAMLIDQQEVEERAITLEQLREADEIAVTNAVRGWRKAVLNT